MVWRFLRLLLRSFALVGLNVALVPLYATLRTTSPGAARAIVRAYCRATCATLGVTVNVDGHACRGAPTLFVANHVSYLDVVILGALLDAAFIAKREVASWPLLGQLGKLSGTLFVHRHWRAVPMQLRAMAERLESGRSLVLFAEGTSTDGLAVRRFKTSLLAVGEANALACAIAIQPVTLAFSHWADGTPIGPGTCDRYAWYGEAEFLPHLLHVAWADGVQVGVSLGTPVSSSRVSCRKELAARLHAEIEGRLRQGLQAQAATLSEPSAGAALPA